MTQSKRNHRRLRLLGVAGIVLIVGVHTAPAFDDAPPIAMGLWETVETVSLTMPGMTTAMPPHSISMQSCATPQTWSDAWVNATQHPGGIHCEPSNMVKTSEKLEFDLKCGDPKNPQQTGHLKFLFDDTEHAHGTIHMESSAAGRMIVIDGTVAAHHVGNDCGGLKPGESKKSDS